MVSARNWFVYVVCALAVSVCVLVVSPSARVVAQELSTKERAELQGQYDELQAEIAKWQKVLTDTRAKKSSLQGDVTLLNAQIKQAEAQIRQKNLAISKLSDEIKNKTARITYLENRIGKGKESLASFLRERNQVESLSFVEIALASDNAFEMFDNIDDIQALEQGLNEAFELIRNDKKITEEERIQLRERQDAEQDAKFVVELKKTEIKEDETEKQKLLAITKNEEQSYSAVLADRQAKAAEIRNRLFNLRDSGGIPFSTALEYARFAESKTGVRAAMILAILSQESDLGKNVGSCLVTDLKTGDGKGKNTGTPFAGVMKVPRDTVPFESITTALGVDWTTTPVSCPIAGGGYGGAMGPSQFIPSTWIIMEPKLKTALGVKSPDPWNAKHAVTATALYMADLGAGLQTYSAERNAACRYYSGRSCDSQRPINYTYGDSVVAKATKFQTDITFLDDN